ncbi:hypothetical protein HNW13_018065 [Shewanella sp. BF02_Schw]|uniref:hypothetical protein n=1 Tax=Shewanella sp. BF02_Schw TaxID=394908 RepID=UPI0017863A72|nr:hypothetical protein [Shewanella sp. BF02_Schw]MBO1897646.1 hypothetical protein [Shewanella sp. BF02_Schw]
MNLDIRSWDIKKKIKVTLLIVVFVACGIYLMPQDESTMETVSFGEPISRSYEDSQAEVADGEIKWETEGQHTTTHDFDLPEKVTVPKFNFIVELAKIIENVQNKPEAMLYYKYTLSEQMLEKRANLQELLARESTAKLNELTSQKEINAITNGVSLASSSPVDDITASTVNKALFEYNYQPSDFSLKNVKKTVDGIEGIIEYRGEFYAAHKGRELLTMVRVLNVTADRVELATPNIPSFNVVLKL